METLSEIKIRLIEHHEKQRWYDLLEQHHYIGAPANIYGERLLYVAVDSSDNWLALIGWCSGIPHLEDRDKLIGWSHSIRKKRLIMIANNFRFLILPNVKIKNLASKVLSLNLKRLSYDWGEQYGHPLYLVETFVDSNQFYGGCYRAANWQLVGRTKGFSRTSKGASPFEFHGNQKLIFIKTLHKRAYLLLADPQFRFKNCWGKEEEVLILDVNRLPIEGKNGLIDVLKTIPDERRRQAKKHNQLSILCLSVCALLSGAKGFKGIHQWASKLTATQKRKMRVRNLALPSVSTIRRRLISVDATIFDETIYDWLFKLASTNKIKGLSVDGKVLRGSKDRKQKTVHLLSALMHDEKITLAQTKIEDKENEIPNFIPLIENLPLNGAVVTADAMHCQVEHAEYLVKTKKSDYAFVVKGNQPSLLNFVQEALSNDDNIFSTHDRVNCEHGRIDERKVTLLELGSVHKRDITFPYANHICKIQRFSEDKASGKKTSFERYFITSLSSNAINAELMMDLILKHWQIESGHWIRDEIFREDHSRIRKGSGPQVMATIRNLSIGIMRYAGAENMNEGMQEMGWANASKAMRSIGIR